MVVDKDVIMERLAKIDESIRLLQDVHKVDIQEFKKSPKEYMYVERCLQVAIEACLDIGAHLISSLNLRKYDDYKDIFIILSEAGVLPEDFAKELILMVGFRNILVHEYMKINLDEVYKNAVIRITDFKKFAEYINKFLEKDKE